MSRRSRPFGVVSLPTLLLAGCMTAGNPLALASVDGPTVVSIQPASGMIGIEPASPVLLRFSRPMVVRMDTFVMLHEGSVVGPAIAVSATWSVDRTTLTLVPTNALRRATTYVVHTWHRACWTAWVL